MGSIFLHRPRGLRLDPVERMFWSVEPADNHGVLIADFVSRENGRKSLTFQLGVSESPGRGLPSMPRWAS